MKFWFKKISMTSFVLFHRKLLLNIDRRKRERKKKNVWVRENVWDEREWVGWERICGWENARRENVWVESKCVGWKRMCGVRENVFNVRECVNETTLVKKKTVNGTGMEECRVPPRRCVIAYVSAHFVCAGALNHASNRTVLVHCANFSCFLFSTDISSIWHTQLNGVSLTSCALLLISFIIHKATLGSIMSMVGPRFVPTSRRLWVDTADQWPILEALW